MVGNLIIIGVCLAIIAFLNSPFGKGWIGEIIVHFASRYSFPKDQYHVIGNVTIPAEGGTTQIDHIVVSRYGVFVVETKNLTGWIFGTERDATWTQQIYRHKNKFQNPLRQNSCVVPPRELIVAYEGHVSSVDDRIEVNERTCCTLGAIRDTLLPKLLFGAVSALHY